MAEEPAATPAPKPVPPASDVALTPAQVSFFNRQLASMARLNMPIVSGLKVVAREVTDASFRGVVSSVQQDLEEGVPLYDAVAKFPRTFSPSYVEILRAGIGAGNLSVVLDELTRYNELLAKVRTQLRDAMLYPAFVGAMTFIFALALLGFIVPGFASLYATMSLVEIVDGSIVVKSPLVGGATALLFSLSNAVRTPGILFVALIAVAGAVAYGVTTLRRGFERTEDFMFGLPLFGRLIRQATLMRVVRTMRDLLTNGVSMVNTLALTARIAGENRVRERLLAVKTAVEEGGAFSRALDAETFSDAVVWKLQIGEEKGIVEETLNEVAQELERDIETMTAYLTSVLSPLLLVVVAMVLLIMLVPLYTQLIQIATSVAG